jgi:hypothetical protein
VASSTTSRQTGFAADVKAQPFQGRNVDDWFSVLSCCLEIQILRVVLGDQDTDADVTIGKGSVDKMRSPLCNKCVFRPRVLRRSVIRGVVSEIDCVEGLSS